MSPNRTSGIRTAARELTGEYMKNVEVWQLRAVQAVGGFAGIVGGLIEQEYPVLIAAGVGELALEGIIRFRNHYFANQQENPPVEQQPPEVPPTPPTP